MRPWECAELLDKGRYTEFVQRTNLLDIVPKELRAKSTGQGEPDGIQLKFDVASKPWDEGLQYRVRANARVDDEDGDSILELSGTWMVFVSVENDAMEGISEEIRVQYQKDVVLMAVVPYVREMVQSTCAKFGVPGIVVPLVKRDQIDRMQHGPMPESEPEVAST